MKREREEKKRYLLRKLSFRPTIEELKNRKVRSRSFNVHWKFDLLQNYAQDKQKST